MKKVILQPTELAQWQSLVQEAQQLRQFSLDEDLESYLVFMLMRFANSPEMAASVMGTEFLESMQCLGNLRHDKLRDVGDKCLLLSGLFPGRVKRKQVTLSYFVDLGQSAYSQVSSVSKKDLAVLYGSLCEGFIKLMDILHAMREVDGNSASIATSDAAELWNTNGDKHALEILKRKQDNKIVIDINEDKLH